MYFALSRKQQERDKAQADLLSAAIKALNRSAEDLSAITWTLLDPVQGNQLLKTLLKGRIEEGGEQPEVKEITPENFVEEWAELMSFMPASIPRPAATMRSPYFTKTTKREDFMGLEIVAKEKGGGE